MSVERSFKEEKKPSDKEPDGGVAQLGEHLPCKQGVMGSNPIISTKGRRRPQAPGEEGRKEMGS